MSLLFPPSRVVLALNSTWICNHRPWGTRKARNREHNALPSVEVLPQDRCLQTPTISSCVNLLQEKSQNFCRPSVGKHKAVQTQRIFFFCPGSTKCNGGNFSHGWIRVFSTKLWLECFQCWLRNFASKPAWAVLLILLVEEFQLQHTKHGKMSVEFWQLLYCYTLWPPTEKQVQFDAKILSILERTKETVRRWQWGGVLPDLPREKGPCQF